MKTLKLQYVNGRYDIIKNSGSTAILDSNQPNQRKQIVEQRVLKAIRDKQSIYDSDYGMGIASVIGGKLLNPLQVLMNFEKLKRFYAKIRGKSGNVAIQNLEVGFPTETSVVIGITTTQEKSTVVVT